jgi:EF hand
VIAQARQRLAPYKQQKMKTRNILLILTAVGLSTFSLHAQDAGGSPPPHGGPHGKGPHPQPPLIKALDSNDDGKIDATEIANAATALAALDKDGDGQISSDELQPPRPDGAPKDDGKHPHFKPAVLTAFDTNGDGALSAEEIANGPAALKTLDKNGDGELTFEEFMGPPPGDGALPGHPHKQ